MEIEALLAGSDLIEGNRLLVRAKLQYADGSIDTVRMSIEDYKKYMGERVSITVAPQGSISAYYAQTAAAQQVDAANAAVDEMAPKRGRKPGQKNKKKLVDLAGVEVKNAAGKAFKSQGLYSREDAQGILDVIKVNNHKMAPMFVERLQWIVKYNGMAQRDEKGRTFKEAMNAPAKPDPVIEPVDEVHDSKGNKKKAS